jgi:two-component system nitrogen regulation response regulator NtrX
MPDGCEGIELLKSVKKVSPETSVVIMTAYADINTAVEAMKLGASDFFRKPFAAGEIDARLQKIEEKNALIRRNERLTNEIDDEHVIIGNSATVKDLKKKIELVAASDASVLITGSHGSGKELIAWAIQRASKRANSPFIRVNCAAIPENLIEAELFGTEKGSYTGSEKTRLGKFKQADTGTLFLDEIADMSLNVQAKMLRTLEYGEITPIGKSEPENVDIRVIAATNKNLEVEMREGRFREDLYYRINTVQITSPPLSARKEDISLLIDHFVLRLGRASSSQELFTEEAIGYLSSLEWPGNIRELKNAIERLIIFNPGKKIDRKDITDHVKPHIETEPVPELNTQGTLKDARASFEKQYIEAVIRESKNMTVAADRLGFKRGYLYQKMNELGINHEK